MGSGRHGLSADGGIQAQFGAAPLARGRIVAKSLPQDEARVGIVAAKQIEAVAPAAVLHSRGRLNAREARNVGQFLPPRAVGPGQAVGLVAGNRIVQSCGQVDVSVAIRGRKVVQSDRQRNGWRYPEEIILCQRQQVALTLAVQPVRSAAQADKALGRGHAGAIGHGLHQVAHRLPLTAVKHKDIPVEHLLATLNQRHVGEVATAGNQDFAVYSPGEGAADALCARHSQRGHRAMVNIVQVDAAGIPAVAPLVK